MKNTVSTVSVYIPALGDEPYIEGCLNGTNFRIKTGEVVEVPAYIANILRSAIVGMQRGAAAVEAYTAAGGKKLD